MNWLFRLSGDEWAGDYEGYFTLPRLSESGLWSLDYVALTDAARNLANLDLANLVRAGLPTQILVNSQPALALHQEGETLWLSWPVMEDHYVLQSSDSPAINASWADVPEEPLVVGEENLFVTTLASRAQFYRLRKY